MVIAVADYGIRPVMIDNLMVSNVGAGGEGWPWVDKLPMDRGCDPSILTDPDFELPSFLHYCQRYEAVGHAFAKRKMRHDFFSCGGDPLELDADAIARALAPTADGEPDRVLVRSAFMLCHIIPMVNAALESYKRDVCGAG